MPRKRCLARQSTTRWWRRRSRRCLRSCLPRP
nr:MAG TPA: hypothetical protein [Caudoviricetes sp.]